MLMQGGPTARRLKPPRVLAPFLSPMDVPSQTPGQGAAGLKMGFLTNGFDLSMVNPPAIVKILNAPQIPAFGPQPMVPLGDVGTFRRWGLEEGS